jgi:hypothetical protein
MEGWSIPFGFLVFGALMMMVALAGLNEYRKMFFAHPREAMSLEVLLQLIFHPASTPALLSAFLLVAGISFLTIGIIIFLLMLGIEFGELANRLWPNLFG